MMKIPKFKDVKDPKIKRGLMRNAKSLHEIATDEDRPIYEIIAGIKTAISSLELYAEDLTKIKNEFKLLNNE